MATVSKDLSDAEYKVTTLEKKLADALNAKKDLQRQHNSMKDPRAPLNKAASSKEAHEKASSVDETRDSARIEFLNNEVSSLRDDLEKANRANDLTLFDYSDFSSFYFLTGTKVAGISDDLLGFDGFISASDTNEFSIRIRHDFINRLV